MAFVSVTVPISWASDATQPVRPLHNVIGIGDLTYPGTDICFGNGQVVSPIVTDTSACTCNTDAEGMHCQYTGTFLRLDLETAVNRADQTNCAGLGKVNDNGSCENCIDLKGGEYCGLDGTY